MRGSLWIPHPPATPAGPGIAARTEASLQRLVTILRELRVTWARIGAALQITRQSAWERFSSEE
ncbi:hypothetical protein ACIBO2_28575 [Nonomuraea sp. NPDC050022]|uniref:hypothetical protein n=1 Tax=Nonomuraea sp. NPDC050022 TaxID=3364358 RepID=UPI003791C59A